MITMSRYVVRLTPEQQRILERVATGGERRVRMRIRAQILLHVDTSADGPGWDDAQVVEAFDCTTRTAARVRKRYVVAGLPGVLHREIHAGRHPKLDRVRQARLVALVEAGPPAGSARWTMKLLAKQLVREGMVDSIDPATVCRTLQRLRIPLNRDYRSAVS